MKLESSIVNLNQLEFAEQVRDSLLNSQENGRVAVNVGAGHTNGFGLRNSRSTVISSPYYSRPAEADSSAFLDSKSSNSGRRVLPLLGIGPG
jgi:hypothetical protein